METELVDVAKKIVQHDINMLYAIREICSLTAYMNDRDEYPVVFFRGIDSETDSLICTTDKIIALYDTGFLKKQHDELSLYLAKIKEEIIKAAHAIIQEYS